LSAFIAARVASYPSEVPERLRWMSPFVADFAALPLYVGWTETIGIRLSGEIVRWSTEGDYPGVQPVQDDKWVLSALVAGAERHPELRTLLPPRPPRAVDCPCRNHPLFVSGKVLCGTCGGIGWLLPESRAEPGVADVTVNVKPPLPDEGWLNG
jgi:hypothetical protein